MSDGVYTIPDYDALPPDACRWPGCALETGVCERSNNGTCPLAFDYIVACGRCGAAIGTSSLRCPVCDDGAAKSQSSPE